MGKTKKPVDNCDNDNKNQLKLGGVTKTIFNKQWENQKAKRRKTMWKEMNKRNFGPSQLRGSGRARASNHCSTQVIPKNIKEITNLLSPRKSKMKKKSDEEKSFNDISSKHMSGGFIDKSKRKKDDEQLKNVDANSNQQQNFNVKQLDEGKRKKKAVVDEGTETELKLRMAEKGSAGRKRLKSFTNALQQSNSKPTSGLLQLDYDDGTGDRNENDDIRTIFIGNLLASTKKRAVEKYFAKYGTVESVRFRNVPVSNPFIPKTEAVKRNMLHPNASTMNAFLRYKDESSVSSALQANGELFNNSTHLRVDKCCTTSINPRHSIFIGNLPFGATNEELYELFEPCGNIINVRIVRDNVTLIGKGFAYVEFDNRDCVELALQMSGDAVKLRNRELRVYQCKSRPPKKSAATTIASVIGGGEKLIDTEKKKTFPKKEKKKKVKKAGDARPTTPKSTKSFEGVKHENKKVKKKSKMKGDRKKKAMIRKVAPRT